MKQNLLFIPCLIFLLGITTNLSYAQNLIVTLANSNTESFPVSGIQSIKFGTSSMILNETDGTINTWQIDDINNYSFDSDVSLLEQTLVIKEEVTVFPNPSSDIVNIHFVSNHSGAITIDILDPSGKKIQQIYSGKHQGENNYQWQAKSSDNIPNGTYLCRVITDNKVITKSIVIQ